MPFHAEIADLFDTLPNDFLLAFELGCLMRLPMKKIF